MAIEQKQIFCQRCNELVPADYEKVSHILHLLLSVVTGGLWLVVWLWLIIFKGKKATCVRCGYGQDLS